MNISTIIPIHELGEKNEKLLINALTSVRDQEKNEGIKIDVILVYPKSLNDEIKKVFDNFDIGSLHITHVINEGDTGFQSQINLGAQSLRDEYFTILEFDDEVSSTYYYNVVKHIKYHKNVDVFLPIIVETNEKEEALKLTNETVWSKSFVGENGELGFLNANALNQYTDFKISGSIIKTKEFIDAGMLKTNIELTFQYEFLLRLLTNGSSIYTIPKIGCKHLADREGSLFDTYGKTLTLKERQFWFKVAKKEANFSNDREIDTSELLSVVE